MTTCTHGHAADPKLCPTCRPAATAATAATAAHTDPAIQAQWDRAAKELDRRIRPFMQDHLVWDLARRFIADLSAQGFRPPLRPPRPPTAPPADGPPPEYLAVKAAITGSDP